jgi:4'-phosphopantetheinyl transferase
MTPALGASDIHLWRIRFSDLSPRVGELSVILSEAEKSRASRYVHASDGGKFIVGRATLRMILAGYLGRRADQIPIDIAEFGKPYVPKSMNNNGLTFNLSHSGDLCLLAVSFGREVGVDIEKIRDDLAVEELAIRYFARKEILELRALPAGLQRLGFFLCWTRKEAYVKARSSGLQIPLDQFEVSLTPDRPAELHGDLGGDWTVQSLDPGPGYVGALVAESAAISISYCDYIG